MANGKAKTENGEGLRINGQLNWRTISLVLVCVLGGGGTGFGFNLLNGEATEQIKEHRTKAAATLKEHKDCIDKNSEDIAQNTGDIAEIRPLLKDVQAVQHKQVAREEARRLTSAIQGRAIREREYDRLVERNISRLRKGQDPCANLDCSN